MGEDHYLVPKQTGGSEKNIEFSITADSVDNAEDLFVSAKDRLLDVNNWAQCAGITDTRVMLADVRQKPLHRNAHPRDHICVIITDTRPVADRLVIGAIEYDDYPDDMRESLAIHIQPADVVTVEASTTIVIDRTGKTLVASYHGRNEPLSETKDTNAWLGLSDVQWSSLLQGFLK